MALAVDSGAIGLCCSRSGRNAQRGAMLAGAAESFWGGRGEALIAESGDEWVQPTAVVMGRTPTRRLLGSGRSVGCASSVKERPAQARSAWRAGSPDGLRCVQFDFGVTAVQNEPGTTTPVPRELAVRGVWLASGGALAGDV